MIEIPKQTRLTNKQIIHPLKRCLFIPLPPLSIAHQTKKSDTKINNKSAKAPQSSQVPSSSARRRRKIQPSPSIAPSTETKPKQSAFSPAVGSGVHGRNAHRRIPAEFGRVTRDFELCQPRGPRGRCARCVRGGSRPPRSWWGLTATLTRSPSPRLLLGLPLQG